MKASQRNTGIPILGQASWGTHICLFYETKDDLIDANVAYFRAGLEANEFCVWAVSDPVTEQGAIDGLRHGIKGFDRSMVSGAIKILSGYEWYLKNNEIDAERITHGWHEQLEAALSVGHSGLRASGNAFWMETNHWKEFREYEQELDRSIAGRAMLVLCTYALQMSRAVDIFEVSRAHNFTIALRKGAWEFLAMPELKGAMQPFSGHELLTPRERVVLAQIVRGASSKEASAILGVSPRTVEFHRANIMQKLRAKNTADLVRIVLGE